MDIVVDGCHHWYTDLLNVDAINLSGEDTYTNQKGTCRETVLLFNRNNDRHMQLLIGERRFFPSASL